MFSFSYFHSFDQVEHLGHWYPGAADFLGEEQEQVNAIIGRRAVTTKHMSRTSTLFTFFLFSFINFLVPYR